MAEKKPDENPNENLDESPEENLDELEEESDDQVRSASGPVHEAVHREEDVPRPEYADHSKNYGPWRFAAFIVAIGAMMLIFWIVIISVNRPEDPTQLPETAISQPETHMGNPEDTLIRVDREPQVEYEETRAGAQDDGALRPDTGIE